MGFEITLAGDVTIGRSEPAAQRRRLRSGQARVAFALLTLERQRGVTRDALAEAVWPDGLPATWESALRTVVSRVRAFVAPDVSPNGDGDPLVAVGGRYLLHLPEDVVVDVEQAEDEVRQAQQALTAGDAAAARERAAAAAERLRAQFLPDQDGDWVTNRREHLAALMVTALELLSQAASVLGDHNLALMAANDAVGRAPLRESAHRCRMAAHAAAGNRGEALRAYQQLRTMLAEELGVDPAPETETAYLSLLGPIPAPAPAPAATPSAGASSLGADLATTITSPVAPPFAGRRFELDQIDEAWRRALAGTPSLVFISGEAGSGKTRLAIEAARRIGADGALVLLGRCDPSRATPYQPLVELLDGFLFALPRDWSQDWRPVVREALATVFPSVAAPGQAPREVHDRAQLFDAVTEILVDAAGDRPILIVLDDAPGADDDTLALVRHLLRHVGEAPLLMLLLARTPLPNDHPLTDALRTLDRDGLVHRTVLGGLSDSDVRALLQELRPDDPAEARIRLARSLVADTSGNPQMVVELLRDLTGASATPVVPPSVQDLVERKLAELGDPARDLLRAAAVVGHEFELAVAARAAGLEHRQLLDALDESLAAGLVAEVGSTCRFTQEIARRTLYDQMSEPRRRHLHLAVADAIEALHGDRLGTHTATLAQHCTAGASPGGDLRAVHWSRLAAAQARADHAPGEVVRLCELALAHVPPADMALHTEVVTELGLALAEVGDHQAEQVLLDAALQGSRAGRPDLAARAALGLADVARLRPGFRAEAAALIDDLLASAELRNGAALVGARLVARAAELSAGAGGPSARCVALAPEAAATLGARLGELAGPADADERSSLAAELATLAPLADETRAGALASHHQAMAAALRGDWKAADREIDAAGDDDMRAQRALAVAVTQGDFAAAEALASGASPGEDPATGVTGAGSDARPAHGGAARAGGAAGFGSPALARRQVTVARWLQGRLGDADDDGVLDPADRALVALARGNRGQARLAVQALATGVDPLPPGDGLLHSLGVLALAAVELGDAATAEAVRAQLAPYAELACCDGYRTFVGTAGFHLGRLAAVGGDLADAERYLMPALSRHAEMQARPWVALTQHALADVLDARGRSSDRDWVEALRSEVRWMAADLGLALR